MSARQALLLGGMMVPLLAGCGRSDFGYAEITLGMPQSPGDTFILNGTSINALQRRKTALIQQTVGQSELLLLRNGQSWLLCKAEISKNRVLKIRIVDVGNTIRCNIK